MRQRSRQFLTSVAMLAVVFTSSYASSLTIDFSQWIEFDQPDEAGGEIVFENGVLTGSMISFASVTGVNTPFHAGAANLLICDMCFLSFQVSATGVGDTIVIDPLGAVNDFTLSGEILSFGDFPGFAGDIVSGKFVGGSLNTGPAIDQFNGEGTDEKPDVLLEYFFGPNPPALLFFGNNEMTLQLDPEDIAYDNDENVVFYRGAVNDGDLSNFPAVPEPGTATLLLLGAGLVAAFRRKS